MHSEDPSEDYEFLCIQSGKQSIAYGTDYGRVGLMRYCNGEIRKYEYLPNRLNFDLPPIISLDMDFNETSLVYCGKGEIGFVDLQTLYIPKDIRRINVTVKPKIVKYNPWEMQQFALASRGGQLELFDSRTNLQPVLGATKAHSNDHTLSKKNREGSITAMNWINQHMVVTGSQYNTTLRVWDIRKFGVAAKSEKPKLATEPVATGVCGTTSIVVDTENNLVWSLNHPRVLYSYDATTMKLKNEFTSPHIETLSFENNISLVNGTSQILCSGATGVLLFPTTRSQAINSHVEPIFIPSKSSTFECSLQVGATNDGLYLVESDGSIDYYANT